MAAARAVEPDGKRDQRGSEQRRGGDDADLERAEAEAGQVDGQQDGDEAVAEVPQGAGCVDAGGGTRAMPGPAAWRGGLSQGLLNSTFQM